MLLFRAACFHILGQWVHVPVGWPHIVLNLQPCLKVAYEVLRPGDVVRAVQMQQHLRRCFLNNTADYMEVAAEVVKELLRWADYLC